MHRWTVVRAVLVTTDASPTRTRALSAKTLGALAVVHAMSRGSIVVACVARLGALIAGRYLPARASEQLSEDDESNEHVLVGSSSR